jgi:hypothetical protein
MFHRLLKSIFLFAVALGFGAFTLSSAEAEYLPFKAMLTGNAHLTPTDDPAVLRNDETGEGEATHLGHFTWADVEFADFAAIPGGVSVVATFTMTAADGDELYGEFTSVGYFADPQTLVIQGEFEFTGGSGRFFDASGSGEIDAFAFLAPGLPFIGTIKGTIDY